MKQVDTGVLLSPPDCLTPAWKLVFRNFADPIRLIVALRDKLVVAFRENPEYPWFTVNELQTYHTLLSQHRTQIDETLSKLNLVAPKTWVIGHEFQNALVPIYSDLGRVGVFFSNRITFTASEREIQVADIRRRVFETSKKFPERPLIEALREAVAAEKSIELEVAWFNAGETNAHMGIVVPSAWVESSAFPTGASRQPAGDEADVKARLPRDEPPRFEGIHEGQEFLSSPELAARFGIDAETLRGRLRRWMPTHQADWKEVADRAPREPRYLYRVAAVRHICSQLANG